MGSKDTTKGNEGLYFNLKGKQPFPDNIEKRPLLL